MNKLLLYCCIVGCCLNQALAYQVQPMIVEVPSQGKKAMITYRLQNPGELPLPVEVEVYKRTFDGEQKEVLVPGEDDFIVLPPQIEVAANGYQIFRAKYTGPPGLSQTSSYRIIFKQLPLADGKKQSGVKMMFNFATLVLVSPKGLTAQPKTSLDCKTVTSCHLTISNQGNKVLDLSHFDYQLNGAQVIKWDTLREISAGRFIMPTHRVKLDLATLIGDKPVTVATMVNLFDQ